MHIVRTQRGGGQKRPKNLRTFSTVCLPEVGGGGPKMLKTCVRVSTMCTAPKILWLETHIRVVGHLSNPLPLDNPVHMAGPKPFSD